MPIWATTWAPCHVSVWMSIWRANGPPAVPADTTATGFGVQLTGANDPGRAFLIVPASAPAYSGAVIKTASDLRMRLRHAMTTGTGRPSRVGSPARSA